jgi:tetratricopeptide (TPR) repeat protein
VTRAWLGILRGDVEQAIDDAAQALESARHMGDPTGMYPSLAVGGVVHGEAGDARTATALLSELADRWSATELAYGAPADMVISWFEHLGTELWREKYDTENAVQTLWLEAARALADEDFHSAISAYERSGAVIDVAAVQLYAARKLAEAGRRAEADAYLQPALSFYRSVGARHRVRQGEELLAATA